VFDQRPFLFQVTLDGAAKPAIVDIMRALRRLGIESAELLETPARASLKTFEPHPDAMFDCRVITNVKMKKGPFFERSPVPAVHDGVIPDIEGPGDNLSMSFRHDQANIAGKTPLGFLKKILRKVLAAILKAVYMSFVKSEHGSHNRRREFATFYGAD
jgi:hypothetical protein